MKRKISMMIMMLLCIGLLSACGNSQETKKGDSKTLILGTNADFPPFEFREGEEVVGFDIELGKYIAEQMGVQLQIEDMAFDGLVPALQAGKIDFILAGLTVEPEKEKNADFSDPYFTASQMILVHKDNNEIKDSKNLANKKIGVQLGTTGDSLAQEIEGAEVVQFPAPYAAVLELQNKKIDAIILDLEPCKRFLEQNEDIKMLEEELTQEEYAAAVQKGDKELLDQINAALKKAKEDGTYDQLLKKYFED